MPGRVHLIPSGIAQLDELIQGFEQGEVVCLNSPMWSGRIHLLVRTLLNISLREEKRAPRSIFLANNRTDHVLEVVEEDLRKRAPSMVGPLMSVQAAIAFMRHGNESVILDFIIIIPYEEPGIMLLLTRIKNHISSMGPAVVAIDCLEYFPDSAHTSGRALASKTDNLLFIANLRRIAQDFGCVIILAVSPTKQNAHAIAPKWLASEFPPILCRDFATASDVVLHLDPGDQQPPGAITSMPTLTVLKCPRGKLGEVDI
jgi:hypothetical protein